MKRQPMLDSFNIPENVRAAALRAVQEVRTEPRVTFYQRTADAAIQACLKESGAREERKEKRSKRFLAYNPRRFQRRLVFPWEPVEGFGLERGEREG
jgi:hypothetical protein